MAIRAPDGNPDTRVSNGSGAVQICINLVKTVAPGWRQIESEMALDMITIPAVSALVSVSVQLYKCICLGKSCKKSGIFYYFCRQIQGGRGSRVPLRFFCIFLKPSRISDRKSFYWSYFLGSSSPTKQ